MEVSKELLSEVLGEDVRLGVYTTVDSDEDELTQHIMKIEIYGNRVSYWRYYKEWGDNITMCKCNINTYELAFKCKEWLYYQIKERIKAYYAPVIPSQYNIDIKVGHSPKVSVQYNNILNKNIKGDYYCRVSASDNSGQYRTFIAETEIEAIIEACEWALNEK